MTAEKTKFGYKFLTDELTSNADRSCIWKIGEWKICKQELKICEVGFHYCKEPIDAFDYICGGKLALVEVGGKQITRDEKTVAEQMRIVKAIDVKAVSVKLAVMCARRCLSNYEKAYPGDYRVRKAIEATEALIAAPSSTARAAVEAAAEFAAARAAAEPAAESAQSAAWSAAWSAAEFAARSAEATARAAVEAAAEFAAARAAESAARDTARAVAGSTERKWQNETLKSLLDGAFGSERGSPVIS